MQCGLAGPYQRKQKLMNRKNPMRKFTVLFLILSILLFASIVMAADVSLMWDANKSAPTGYRLYAAHVGQSFDYTTPLYEGLATTATITGLEETVELKFVARAYMIIDGVTYESPDSIEVRHAIIRAPLNLRTQ